MTLGSDKPVSPQMLAERFSTSLKPQNEEDKREQCIHTLRHMRYLTHTNARQYIPRMGMPQRLAGDDPPLRRYSVRKDVPRIRIRHKALSAPDLAGRV